MLRRLASREFSEAEIQAFRELPSDIFDVYFERTDEEHREAIERARERKRRRRERGEEE